jgi:hypothetical protein
MPHELYYIFCSSFLGLPPDSWAAILTETMFKSPLLHNIDAIVYYFDTDIHHNCKPISYPGDCKDMAKILARLTQLLIAAGACTPNIIYSVWGENKEA